MDGRCSLIDMILSPKFNSIRTARCSVRGSSDDFTFEATSTEHISWLRREMCGHYIHAEVILTQLKSCSSQLPKHPNWRQC
eukprot:scaffold1618_cov158-Ochromonas_danica.AAC.7